MAFPSGGSGGGSGLADRAMIVAMEILRSTIQTNTLALAANTARFAPGTALAAPPIGAASAVPGAAPVPGPPRANPVISIPPLPKPPGPPNPLAPLMDIGKNLAKSTGLAGAGAVSGVVGKLGPAGMAAAPLLSVMEKVVGKFASIIGPMAILDAILNSNIAGFQVLEKSVKVFANTMAPVLLPVTLLLSAGFLALTDVLEQNAEPFQEWFDLVLDLGVPIMEMFLDSIVVTTNAFKVASAVLRSTQVLPMGFGIGGGSEDSQRNIDAGLRDALASFRASLGPKAQISGLEGVGKQAQLAALNGDPIEVRLQRQQLKSLQAIEDSVANRKRKGGNPIMAFAGEAAQLGRSAVDRASSFFKDVEDLFG